MAFIGKTPTPAPLTSSDIASDIINNTHIGDTAISGFDALATAPADTDEFLISDGGVLKRIDASLVGGGGITEADQWRLTADLAGSNGDITSNLERVDSTGFGYIGSGMSQSSGIFTFPSTGIYRVIVQAQLRMNSNLDYDVYLIANLTTNNSSYNEIFRAVGSMVDSGSIGQYTHSNSGLIDVTDTSNVKIKFTTDSFVNSNLQQEVLHLHLNYKEQQALNKQALQ